MTEYKFPVRCIKSYETGGVTYWLKDKTYTCKTNGSSVFQISAEAELLLGSIAFYEMGSVLFHEYFEPIEQTDGALKQCG